MKVKANLNYNENNQAIFISICASHTKHQKIEQLLTSIDKNLTCMESDQPPYGQIEYFIGLSCAQEFLVLLERIVRENTDIFYIATYELEDLLQKLVIKEYITAKQAREHLQKIPTEWNIDRLKYDADLHQSSTLAKKVSDFYYQLRLSADALHWFYKAKEYFKSASVTAYPQDLETKDEINTAPVASVDLSNTKPINSLAAYKARLSQYNELKNLASTQITKISKELYVLTKNFLDKYKNQLTPAEKGTVFNEYIETWKNLDCKLSIKDTDYAGLYTKSSFGKYGDNYNDRVPMMAGFNLSGAIIKGFHPDFIFPDVNFEKADFSYATLPHSHFENCNLNSLKTLRRSTNLNQCQFKKSAINGNDLRQISLSEASITYCSIINTQLPDGVWTYKCKEVAPVSYPSFLKQLHVSEKKLNKDSLAYALWLTHKNPEDTVKAKQQFSLWAQNKNLSFSMDDVEESLNKKYVMQ